MISRLFFAALAATLALASPMTVTLSAPENVSSLDDLKITATVVNTGSDEVRILKYNTILDSEIPTRSFYVKKDDSTVNFTGIAVSLHP